MCAYGESDVHESQSLVDLPGATEDGAAYWCLSLGKTTRSQAGGKDLGAAQAM